MKTLLIMLTMWVFNGTNVPEQVRSAFAKEFPNTENVHWEQRNDNFVATFQSEEGLKKVFYQASGAWLETRTRLSLSELPKEVYQFINSNYHDADVTFAGKVERPDGLVFRIESELPDAVIVKLLNENGVVLEEEKITYSTGMQLPKQEKMIVPKTYRELPPLMRKTNN